MKITATDDYLPTNFNDAVRMLKRPYIPINEKQLKAIETQTNGRGDIFIYRGQRMTWGDADGGYAMMPLLNQ